MYFGVGSRIRVKLYSGEEVEAVARIVAVLRAIWISQRSRSQRQEDDRTRSRCGASGVSLVRALRNRTLFVERSYPHAPPHTPTVGSVDSLASRATSTLTRYSQMTSIRGGFDST
jgi:hypothetical protein